jgi:hypothetical protein
MSIEISHITSGQLQRAVKIKQKIETLTRELDLLLGSTGSSDGVSAGGRNQMSAAGRAAIAAAQKARWAKHNGKTGSKGKRTMSAAARAKISAIAKRRWKAAKAAGQSRL